jgi:hypothetical protein
MKKQRLQKRVWIGVLIAVTLSIIGLFLPLNRNGGLVTKYAEELAKSAKSYQGVQQDIANLNGTILLQSTKIQELSGQKESSQTNLTQPSQRSTTNNTTITNLQNLHNTNITQTSDTLSLLNCSINQVAQFNGSIWACANQTVDTDTDTDTDQQDLSLTANQLYNHKHQFCRYHPSYHYLHSPCGLKSDLCHLRWSMYHS